MGYLFTTGYQGENINQFLNKLQEEKISTIVDIRQNPNSRKKGFSKKILELSLNEQGIKYYHFQELGTPKPLREFLIKSQDYDLFFSRYKEFLLEYQDSLFDLVDMSEENKLCLLCFEKDPHQCHRKVIVEILKEYFGKDIKISHI